MMKYTVKEVKTKREAKVFTKLPIKLFSHIDAFVPALTMDELNVFDPKKNPAHEYCESIRFLAYEGKKVVGRIAGIINHKYNEAFKTKIVRFTRIDMIDDIEVTKLLINTIESWGKSKGMDTIIGPIGFTDMDRMGMLVDGFEYLGSFITIWNPKYYHEHLEKIGFIKDADWIESQIKWPESIPDRIERGTKIVRERYGYELIKIDKIKDLDKYIYDAFDVYNRAFSELYGFFPLTRKVEDYYVKQVKSLVKLDFLWFVKDKEGVIVAIGVMMPSLAIANKKNKGSLFPFGWIRILRSLRKFDVIDFYFVAVDPKHQGNGVMALIIEDGIKQGMKYGVRIAETGPELELNKKIQAQWLKFEPNYHKRRRCYTKEIN